MKILAAAVFSVAVLLALPGEAAQPNPTEATRRLRELESALAQGRAEQEAIGRKAAAITAEVDSIREDMVKAARAVQEHEEALSELELQLRDLSALEKDKAAALELKRQQMNAVLAALQRLAFRPTEALLAQPTPPADTVRSAILLRDIAPKIKEQAESLRTEIESLARLRTDIDRHRKKILSTSEAIDLENQRLSGLYQRKAAMQQAAEAQSRQSEQRLQAMAAEAEDLRDLMTKLDEERKRQEREAADRAAAEKAAREAQIAAAKAAREAALQAEQARRDAEIAETRALKERHEAEIVALRQAKEAEEASARAARDAKHKAEVADRQAEQAAAQIVEDERQATQRANRPFSGAQGAMPFPARGPVTVHFGQTTDDGVPSKGIVIETRASAQVIAPYDGQIVFAGPFRGYGLLLIIEHGEGYHTLLAGMDRIDGSVGQKLLAGEPVAVMAQTEGKPLLYVELRHNGQPVNPLTWLTARKIKVNG